MMKIKIMINKSFNNKWIMDSKIIKIQITISTKLQEESRTSNIIYKIFNSTLLFSQMLQVFLRFTRMTMTRMLFTDKKNKAIIKMLSKMSRIMTIKSKFRVNNIKLVAISIKCKQMNKFWNNNALTRIFLLWLH